MLRIPEQMAGLALYIVPLALALSWAATIAGRRECQPGSRHTAVFSVFCVYVVVLATLTLAPPPIFTTNGSAGTNLVPLFYSARCFVPNPGQPSTTRFCLQTIGGNVVVFIPLGILLPLVSRTMWSLRRVAIVALVGSISIETLQWVGQWVGSPRWTDVDDVIWNVTGAVVGYVLIRWARSSNR